MGPGSRCGARTGPCPSGLGRVIWLSCRFAPARRCAGGCGPRRRSTELPEQGADMSAVNQGARGRAASFGRKYALRVPILMAPMAGACPVGLAAAVANAGGMGAFGALMTAPDAIAGWANGFRGQSNGAFQINLWVPDPPPRRDPEHEARLREFLGQWGPPVAPEAGDARPFDFDAQCEAMIEAAPQIVSSIMGVFPEKIVAELKA